MGRQIFDPSQLVNEVVQAKALRFPGIEYFLYDDFLRPHTTVLWDSVGTISRVALRGGAFRTLSGAVAGNQGLIDLDPASALWFTANRDFIFQVRVRSNQTLQNRIFLGLYSARPTGAAPPVEPSDAIYFRRADAAAVANWYAVTRAGAAETAVDTTIVGDTSWHIYRIRRTGNVVEFYIDGVRRATITTNLPAVDVGLGIETVTQEAVAKSLDIDYLVFIQER